MSLTSYRAAPPRATGHFATGKMSFFNAFRLLPRAKCLFVWLLPKERAAYAARLPVGGPFVSRRFNMRLADLAATYSPAS